MFKRGDLSKCHQADGLNAAVIHLSVHLMSLGKITEIKVSELNPAVLWFCCCRCFLVLNAVVLRQQKEKSYDHEQLCCLSSSGDSSLRAIQCHIDKHGTLVFSC